MKRYPALIATALILTALFWQASIKLHYDDYKDIISALVNVSSIIFAIIGAWIAIIYPKAIGRTFHPQTQLAELNHDTDSNYLAELVEIVLVSASVLMAILIIQFAFPVLRSADYLGISKDHAKVAAFFTIALLTILQVHSVFRVILANYFFLNEVRKKVNSETIKRLHD